MATKKSSTKATSRKAENTSSKGKEDTVSKDVAFTQQFRSAIIQKLDDWVETVPQASKPLIGSADGSAALSPKDIVKHVKDRTPLGEKVVSNWAELTLKSIKNTPLV
jgi:hypothetical protein